MNTSAKKTAPEPIRDQKADHLLTPKNTVIALIDYQSTQLDTLKSKTRERAELNVRVLSEVSRRWGVPIVVSTVGVDMGVNPPTIPEIMEHLPEDQEEIDRTGVNAWEDADFRAAIEATGAKHVVVAGLWTEVCVALPTLDMLNEGYKVYPVVDAIGGISKEAHESAITRMVQAGASPVTAISFASEIMRNWAREDSNNLREIFGWYFPAKGELDQKEDY